MKLNVLLLGAAMAAFSITAFAGIGAYALKPADATKLSRAAGFAPRDRG